MVSPIILSPASIIDAHNWWTTSNYPAHNIFKRAPLELIREEVKGVVQVRSRYYVEFERDGLQNRILLRDLPEALKDFPITQLPFLQHCLQDLKNIRWLTTTTALFSGLLGAGILYAIFPVVRGSALLAVATTMGLLVILPLTMVLVHARISLTRCKDAGIRRSVKLEIAIFTLLAFLLAGSIFRAYIKNRHRYADSWGDSRMRHDSPK